MCVCVCVCVCVRVHVCVCIYIYMCTNLRSAIIFLYTEWDNRVVDRGRVNCKPLEEKLQALFEEGMTAYRGAHQKQLVQLAIERTSLTVDNVKVINIIIGTVEAQFQIF